MEVEWTGETESGEGVRISWDSTEYDFRMLKLTLDECKEKLKVNFENQIYQYISLNGTSCPCAKTRTNLQKDPRNLIRILREQILSVSKPKRYPGWNTTKTRKYKGLLGETIKKRVLKKLESGDLDGLKKMCQAKKSPLDRVKKDLRRAITDEDYCLDLMKKYLSLLPSPADF